MARRERVSGLRGGVKVRSLVEDVNIEPGMLGTVVNVTPQYMKEAKVMVAWSNDTRCFVEESAIEIVPAEETA